MTIANRYTGKDLYVEFICAAGTIALNGDFRTFTVDREADMVDITAGSETDKSYTSRLKDGTAELEVLDQASIAATGIEAAMPEGTSGTLMYAPQGTASTKPKRGFVAFVSSISVDYPYDDVVAYSISFQKSGTVLFAGTAQYA
jgi:predicted secreted protein